MRCGVVVLRIAAVSSDENIRRRLAEAFDEAPSSWRITLHEEAPLDADVIVCGPDRSHDGAVRFDPDRSEDLVAEIGARLALTSRGAIFVVGAAGGCGATTVALHLAALAGGCALEASAGDMRRRLDLGTARSWAATDDEPVELGAVPVAPGFRVLLSPGASPLEEVHAVLGRSLAAFEHVLVDSPASCLDGLAGGDGHIGVIVLTPTRPSAVRAREIASAHPSIRWAFVTNRVGPGSALTRRSIEALLGWRIALELPCSAGLRDAEDHGRLLTSAFSPWLWQLKRLWRALATA